MEFAKTKAAIAGLPALVHAPALDSIYPAANEGLVSLSYKVEKGSIHDFCGRQEAVVGAIVDRTGRRKPVEDEGSANGLFWEWIKSDGTIRTSSASPRAGG